jgi:hypothetical protein
LKIGRNSPCPCGSGRKYKKCHGGPNAPRPAPQLTDQTVADFIASHQAAEKIRQDQQGLGRPIISTAINGHQLVAVGNNIFWSKKWKTFPDFLSAYIKTTLGKDWGNAEIAKPLGQRHQIMQWFDAFARYQQETIKTPGVVTGAKVTGLVACYLGLAYNLYLLAHNNELQERLVKRLLDPGNFQGAYYELIVANILIRAGFTLTLEDETVGDAKHCEFAAVPKDRPEILGGGQDACGIWVTRPYRRRRDEERRPALTS